MKKTVFVMFGFLAILFVGLSIKISYSLNPIVYKAQKKLKELGYDPGPHNGILGQKTTKAIKRFQQDNSLVVTGELNKETAKKLGTQITEEKERIKARVIYKEGNITDFSNFKIIIKEVNPFPGLLQGFGDKSFCWPDEDVFLQVKIKQTDKTEQLRIVDFRSIEFFGKAYVKIIMKEGKLVEGTWEGNYIPYSKYGMGVQLSYPISSSVKIEGRNQRGEKLVKDLFEVAKIEFIK